MRTLFQEKCPVCPAVDSDDENSLKEYMLVVIAQLLVGQQVW